jgi:hypothetical protein
LATVTFDSFSAPAFAGARGTEQVRQLVMRGDEFDIHIKMWGEPSRRQMIGQLLPRHREGFVEGFVAASFHLLRDGKRLETTSVDELGEFRFTDLPEGDLSLQIDLPNLTIIGPLSDEATPQ